MRDMYPSDPDETNEERRQSTRRLLKRLRIALLLWFVAFIATVIWFSCCT